MDQDKKNIDPRDCRNLLALEEESLIDSFKHEFLVLYNERKGSIVLTFIVTNDKMEGNGRVLLHIHSSPSSDLSTTDSTDSSRLASSLSNPLVPANPIFPRSPLRFARPSASKPPPPLAVPLSPLPPERTPPGVSKKSVPSSLAELSGLFSSRQPVLRQGEFHYSAASTDETPATGAGLVSQKSYPSFNEADSFTESEDWSESTEWNFQRYSTVEMDPLFTASPSSDLPESQAKPLARSRWKSLFASEETPSNASNAMFETSLDE